MADNITGAIEERYEVNDLASFAIEAPAMFTAVADKELWEKHFRRKVNDNARGVSLVRNGQKTIYYDVSETTAVDRNSLEVRLWQYNETAHKKFLNAVVSGENGTESQIRIIATELASRVNADEEARKIIALSVEAVIAERMGYSTGDAARNLAQLSFKEQDIPRVLEETQKTARIFLDATQRAVAKRGVTPENVSAPENNPLIAEIGIIHADFAKETPLVEIDGEISGFEVMVDNSGNPDYDFEEMDDEEEILSSVAVPETPQPTSEIPVTISEQNSQIEVISENAKKDLATAIAEDMNTIRGNSQEKIIFRKNVAAIRTLHYIEGEKRAATAEELAGLREYAGFGGIPKAFDKTDPEWNREAWLLQSMLSDKEYQAARGSTLNAHYTPAEVAQGIYVGLEKLGFHQGTVLEPSMGVGNFFRDMPAEMKAGSHLYGVELDSLTGRMAQLIIGRVPFGNYRVNENDRPGSSRRLSCRHYFQGDTG